MNNKKTWRKFRIYDNYLFVFFFLYFFTHFLIFVVCHLDCLQECLCCFSVVPHQLVLGIKFPLELHHFREVFYPHFCKGETWELCIYLQNFMKKYSKYSKNIRKKRESYFLLRSNHPQESIQPPLALEVLPSSSLQLLEWGALLYRMYMRGLVEWQELGMLTWENPAAILQCWWM